MKELFTTLLLVIKDEKILLAKKKRGFGVGKYNGIGGKVEIGETIEQAMLRETREEINVVPLNYEKRATIIFDEYVKEERTKVVMSVYVANEYVGEPKETEEMCPQWFDIDKIPYGDMFPDDRIWLPRILNGKNIEANFLFDKEFKLLEYKVDEVLQFNM